MGFFSDMWDSLAGPDDTQLAIIDAIALTIYYDGEISEEEKSFAVGFVASMLNVDSAEADEQMAQGVERVYGRNFREVLGSIASRLPDFGSKMGVDATRKWREEGFQRLVRNFRVDRHLGRSVDEGHVSKVSCGAVS